MRSRYAPFLTLGFLLVFVSAFSTPSFGEETWHRMLMGGVPAGYIHEITNQLTENDRKLIETIADSQVVLKRMGTEVKIRTQMTSVEDAASGELVRGAMSLDMSGTGAPNETSLVVHGKKASLTTKTLGSTRTTEIDWDPEIRGPQFQQRVIENGKRTPGETFSFKTYSFEYGGIITVTTEIIGPEKVSVQGKESTLTRTKNTNDVMTWLITDEWRDERMRTLKTFTVQAGLEVVSEVSTAEEALASLGTESPFEAFLPLTPQSNVLIPHPYQTDEVVMHIKPLKKELELPDFNDERQTVEKSFEDGSVRVRLRSVVPPAEHRGKLLSSTKELTPDIAENLEASPFLQSDDPKIVETAKRVVGEERDPWKAARLLESFVFDYIDEKGMDVAFATAREVLDSKSGDCSEHGVLLAALARAAGIPSRAAVGLLYFNGAFGGHMWTEVLIDGRWYALDGTLGNGRVDACHLAIDKSSMKSSGMAQSMIGITRALGNMDIDFLEIAIGDKRFSLDEGETPYRVEEGRYVNHLFGIAFTAPSGFSFTQLDPKEIQAVLLKLEPLDKSSSAVTEISIRVETSRPELTLAQAASRLEAGGSITLDVPRSIDGRRGRMIVVEKEGGVVHASALIEAHGSIFLIRATSNKKSDEALQQLDKLLKSLDFDVESPFAKAAMPAGQSER